ncbi:MAG: hypothetical protein WA006_05800 [Rhodoglobus sp.]
MSRVRVEIDLNSRDADGFTRTKLKNASGPVEVGQIVTAFESEDSVQALAYVARVEEGTGYVLLDVNWNSLCDDDGTEAKAPFSTSNAVNRAAASVHNKFSASSGATGSLASFHFVDLPRSA